VGSHSNEHAGARRAIPAAPRWQHVALGLATVATVSGAGGVGYALTAHATPVAPVPAAAPAPQFASPLLPTTTPPARPVVTGPVLVDQDGRALDPALAHQVTTVYAALSSGDLETIRQAYAATGSDDWITSNPHLRSSTVRGKLLSAPAHSTNGSYRYSAAGYRVTFGPSDSRAAPGLWLISGPWSNSTTSTSPTTTSTSSRSTSARTTTSAICDLNGPPVFGDPAHPNVITNRDCGYTDAQGHARSHDPWIDDQLTAAGQ
jgi:hypothetical protein